MSTFHVIRLCIQRIPYTLCYHAHSKKNQSGRYNLIFLSRTVYKFLHISVGKTILWFEYMKNDKSRNPKPVSAEFVFPNIGDLKSSFILTTDLLF